MTSIFSFSHFFFFFVLYAILIPKNFFKQNNVRRKYKLQLVQSITFIISYQFLIKSFCRNHKWANNIESHNPDFIKIITSRKVKFVLLHSFQYPVAKANTVEAA